MNFIDWYNDMVHALQEVQSGAGGSTYTYENFFDAMRDFILNPSGGFHMPGSGGGGGTGGGGGGTPTTQTVNVTGPGTYQDNPNVNETFVFHEGTYDYTIHGFNSGDVLDFPAGVEPTVINKSFSDGQVTLQWAHDNHIIDVTITDLPLGDEVALSGINGWDQVFGDGTIQTGAPTPPSGGGTSGGGESGGGSSGGGSTGGGGTHATQTVNVTGPGTYQDNPNVNETFVFHQGTYNYTIDGFNAGDVLDFPAGAEPTVINNSFSDGKVTLQWAHDNNVIQVTVVGVPVSDEVVLSSIHGWDQVFGDGTIHVG